MISSSTNGVWGMGLAPIICGRKDSSEFMAPGGRAGYPEVGNDPGPGAFSPTPDALDAPSQGAGGLFTLCIR